MSGTFALRTRPWPFALVVGCILWILATFKVALAAGNEPPPGFVSLFNGRDLAGWKVPDGDNGHWKVLDGVIDYDAQSEAKADKSLWTDRGRANGTARPA